MEQASSAEQASRKDVDCVDDSSLDPVDVIRGLAHMDVLRERVDARIAARRRVLHSQPRNSIERHILEEGHRLAPGCCAPYVERAA